MKPVFALCLSLTAMPSVSDASTVINFNDQAAGPTFLNHYTGVTFANAKLGSALSVPGPPWSNYMVSLSDGFMPQQSNPISAVFAATVSVVSVTGLDIGSNGFILKAFDATSGGNLVDSVSFTGILQGNGSTRTLTVSGAGILRVEFSQITNDLLEGMAFDDFTYEISQVPLPATLPLGLGAIAVMGLVGRRRKA